MFPNPVLPERELGMVLAVVGTMLRVEANLPLILLGIAIGGAIGIPLAFKTPMTAVPQLTALSHAFGALASALIGTVEFYEKGPEGFIMGALGMETLLGYLTTTASIIAFAKLQELMPTRPLTYPGQNETAYKFHAQIYEAIAARDPDAAERVIRAHLDQVTELYWRVKGGGA